MRGPSRLEDNRTVAVVGEDREARNTTPTVSERASRGRAARSAVPRRLQSALDLTGRGDPIVLLEDQAKTRLAELIPLRYGRMLNSPLAFFRGAAVVMARDLATTPQAGLLVQLCGDAHLLNFGGFASPERDLLFDLNDFDETLPGPFEWDVKRLAASIEIAARDHAFGGPSRSKAVLGAVRSYRETMLELAGRGNLDVWYADADAKSLAVDLRAHRDRRAAKVVDRTAAHAPSSDSVLALKKLTRVVDGRTQIRSDPPDLVPIVELVDNPDELEAGIRSVVGSYLESVPRDRRVLLESFRYSDAARKVVGIGSVGTHCYVVLLFGRDERDPLVLQLKEAQSSTLEPFLGVRPIENQGRRVVEGQRLSQAFGDIFLGWTRADDLDGTSRDFYVRQLRDWKVSLDVDRLDPHALAIYGRWCAAALARAHARSGDRIAIAAYLGKGDHFDRAISDFAAAYADVNEQDYATLVRAVRERRVTATTDA
jgi:uncharacterized protein (DUF2252 family)